MIWQCQDLYPCPQGNQPSAVSNCAISKNHLPSALTSCAISKDYQHSALTNCVISNQPNTQVRRNLRDPTIKHRLLSPMLSTGKSLISRCLVKNTLLSTHLIQNKNKARIRIAAEEIGSKQTAQIYHTAAVKGLITSRTLVWLPPWLREWLQGSAP